LGGTKIAAGLVSFPFGGVITKEIVPTLPARGGQAVLNDTINLAYRLKDHASRRGLVVQGIGIGIAELVNLQGEITSDYLIKWKGLRVKQSLSQIAPVQFESDARAPAVGEALFGAGKQYKIFIFVTVGTGISYCLVLEGRPYAGANGHAIMMASGILTSECEKCGTVQDQVLEEFASGPALVSRYNRDARASLSRGQEVTAAATAGDEIAGKVVRSAGEALGNSVGFLVNVLDPQAVIVGGGLGLAGGLYWESFIHSTRRRIWSKTSRDLPIIRAKLGEDAGLIGAAALFRSESRRERVSSGG